VNRLAEGFVEANADAYPFKGAQQTQANGGQA